MMHYNYLDKKRDLTSILVMLMKEEPRFIRNFEYVEKVSDIKCEWEDDYNYLQSFSEYIVCGVDELTTKMWGNVDNQVNRQTAKYLSELSRKLNRAAIFGIRDEKTKNKAGGLYSFACGEGSIEIDAKGTEINDLMIKEAKEHIASHGYQANQIICSPEQANMLLKSHDYVITDKDEKRNAYVAIICHEGNYMTIISDPDMINTECWVVDTGCFGMACHTDGLKDADTTPKGFDGVIRTATGKFTFIFKDAKKRCCRIKNLKLRLNDE